MKKEKKGVGREGGRAARDNHLLDAYPSMHVVPLREWARQDATGGRKRVCGVFITY